MAPFAVLYGEGDREMADAAKLAAQDVIHTKVFRALFLDIEDVRVTVGAVEPFGVLLMGKQRLCLSAPFGPAEGSCRTGSIRNCRQRDFALA
jgi:hypothetical protein